MILLACVDQNWGIGKDNQLLFSIKEDMQWFKETTINHTVIMGMNTLKSLPNRNPLSNRNNIVLTRSDITSNDPFLRYAHSIEELIQMINQMDDSCFCIGGGTIYNQLLPYCKEAHITFVYKSKEADTFLTNLDQDTRFSLVEKYPVPNIEYPNLVERRVYFNKLCIPTNI